MYSNHNMYIYIYVWSWPSAFRILIIVMVVIGFTVACNIQWPSYRVVSGSRIKNYYVPTNAEGPGLVY